MFIKGGLAMIKDVVLNNGVKIPEIGYGTWLIDNNDAFECVSNAFKCGYRHIDSAQDYGNEVEVGRAIRESGLAREEIFLTTKVASRHKSYEAAKKSIEESLQKLGVGYIDLLLIHCPTPWDEYRGRSKTYFKENIEVYRAMEEFYKSGKVKALGISNFNIDDTKNILDNSTIKVSVNQIPLYVGNVDEPLIEYCNKENIVVEAYSPIAHGRALDNPLIKQMAEKYNVSIASLCIKFTLQLGTVSLPKASKLEHMKDNLNVDFSINEEDMEKLKHIVQR